MVKWIVKNCKICQNTFLTEVGNEQVFCSVCLLRQGIDMAELEVENRKQEWVNQVLERA